MASTSYNKSQKKEAPKKKGLWLPFRCILGGIAISPALMLMLRRHIWVVYGSVYIGICIVSFLIYFLYWRRTGGKKINSGPLHLIDAVMAAYALITAGSAYAFRYDSTSSRMVIFSFFTLLAAGLISGSTVEKERTQK